MNDYMISYLAKNYESKYKNTVKEDRKLIT